MSDLPQNLHTPESPLPPTLPLAPVTPSTTIPATKPWEIRLWSGLIFTLSALMLGIGLYLHPSPTGLETHRQLGLPPCGWFTVTGVPCPTCGCTTAVSYVAHGHFLKALLTQPFGAAIGFLGIAGLLFGGIGLVTARWRGPQPFTLQWYWRSLVLGGIGLLLFGWMYKILAVRHGW